MIKVQPAVTQMNNGHLAPILEGRTDIQVYGYSCRQTENAIPLVYGANKNRGGTIYVSSTKSPLTKAVLVPFVVSESISYQLEFGDQYIRFYKNHEPIMYQGEVYEISSPYIYEDLFDEKGLFQLDYAQSGDVLFIAHDKYMTKKLARFSDTNWEISDLEFVGGPWLDRNLDEKKVISASATTGNISLTAGIQFPVNPSFEGDMPKSIFPRARGCFCRFYLNNVPFPEDKIYRYSAGLSETVTDLAKAFVRVLNGCQSDLVASEPSIRKLRVEAVKNQSNYSQAAFKIEYSDETDSWSNPTTLINPQVLNFTFSEYITSAEYPTFTEDMVGRRMRIKNVGDYEPWYSGRTGVAINDICISDGKYYQALTAGTCGNVKPVHEEGIESDGKISWKFLGDGYGIVRIQSYTSPQEVNGTVEKELMPSLTDPAHSSWRWEMELVGLDGVYPSSIAFFKDRLALGINSTQGPKVIFSRSGDYENFEDMTFGQVLSDNAITLNILTDLNKINWLSSADNLFVGTEGGVVMVKAMTDNEVFGPDNVTYDEISNIGSCKVKPIRIGDDILYLGRLTKDVYAIAYNFQTDSYEPDEVSISAYDLLEQGVTSWALQYEPNRVVWMIRRDGKLVGFTYNKKQSVRAFHLHSTEGKFEDVSCIPSPDGTQDRVFTQRATVKHSGIRLSDKVRLARIYVKELCIFGQRKGVPFSYFICDFNRVRPLGRIPSWNCCRWRLFGRKAC